MTVKNKLIVFVATIIIIVLAAIMFIVFEAKCKPYDDAIVLKNPYANNNLIVTKYTCGLYGTYQIRLKIDKLRILDFDYCTISAKWISKDSLLIIAPIEPNELHGLSKTVNVGFLLAKKGYELTTDNRTLLVR